MNRFLFILSFLFFTQTNAIEFNGKFIQGHFILGKTNPGANILIDKKKIKVSKEGYFVFGLDRDRKYDVIINIKSSNSSKKIVKKILKRK